MARALGRLTVTDATQQELAPAIAMATGLQVATVRRKLADARGNMLVQNVFWNRWPTDVELLGGLTVSFAREEGFHDEIAVATGLADRTIARRLNEERGNRFLRNVFPEMSEGKAPSKRRVAQGEIEPSVPSLDAWKGKNVSDIRDDEAAVAQLAAFLSKRVSTVKQQLASAHGLMHLGRLFEDSWPTVGSTGKPPTPVSTERTSGPTQPKREATSARKQDVQKTEAPPGLITPALLFADRWRVVAEIGRGGYGTAFEVRDEKNLETQPLVLKVAHDARAIDRLKEEKRIGSSLHHSNICAYRFSDNDPTHGFFVVMHHAGASLDRLIRERGPLDVPVALDVLTQAAAGLEYAHEHGVLHLDVTPGNILVQERPSGKLEVRLTDFGISRHGSETSTRAGSKTVAATMAFGFTTYFASPEQIRSQSVSRRSDQYSLALVFCAMLEGEVFDSPYSRRTFEQLTPRQNQALERALRRNPSDRFDLCREFIEALVQR